MGIEVAGFAVAGGIAGILTLFDLDKTFYVPSSTPQKLNLYLWWWGFVVANGLLAGVLDLVFSTADPFKSWHWFVAAAAIGFTYLALLRQKFSTFNFNGKDVPIGIEVVYDAAKQFAYKRINRIAKRARLTETLTLASNTSLHDLATRVKLSINQDALTSDEDKRSAQAWLLQVLGDTSSELDKRAALADYVLSGTRTPGP